MSLLDDKVEELVAALVNENSRLNATIRDGERGLRGPMTFDTQFRLHSQFKDMLDEKRRAGPSGRPVSEVREELVSLTNAAREVVDASKEHVCMGVRFVPAGETT